MNNFATNNETAKSDNSMQPLTNNLIYRRYEVMANQLISKMFQSGNLKDIQGYEGLYAASKDGRIWSYPKPRSSKYGKWLKLQMCTNTKKRNKARFHYFVHLYKNAASVSFQVHRLVAQTFTPNSDKLPQINHKDGNPLNNNVDNLEWCNATENNAHARETGLVNFHSGNQGQIRSDNGKKTGAINGMKARRMFTMAEADCIRKIHEVGKKSCLAISKAFGCSSKTIDNICNYKSYTKEFTNA